MAELFSDSGLSEDVGLTAPTLQGLFVPAIDKQEVIDGFRLVIPLGGGKTSRNFLDYGISAEVSEEETWLSDLSSAPANQLSYNFEGLVGPQGPPGPQGLPGVTTIQNLLIPYTAGSFGLDTVLEQVADTWSTADTILYTDRTNIFWNLTWESMPIDSDVKSWNEADMDEDGSFMIVAADDGIYVSSDTGDTWTQKTPDSEDFIQAECSDTGEKAVVLGDTSKDDGQIWVSSDYGANWSQKTVSE